MKNQFFGDKNDYFKYDLLLDVLEGLSLPKLTFVPMLTPNDGSSYGGKVEYEQGKRRRVLYEFLQACVREGRRNINELARFFERYPFEFKPYHAERSDFSTQDRSEYFAGISDHWVHQSLVFFDPDIGLQPDTKCGPEHLKFAELHSIIDRMEHSSVFMVIQFLRAMPRPQVFLQKSSQILTHPSMGNVHYISDNEIAFFAGSKSSDTSSRLAEILRAHKEKHRLSYGDTVRADRASGQQHETGPTTELKHRELTERIIGVFYDVYNELGHGFLESVYQGAMEIALRDSGLTVEREVAVPVWFRNRDVGNFKADLLVESCVLLELKTAQAIDRAHEGQLMNYLRATQIEVGLLLNFGPRLQFKRFVFENARKRIRVHPRKSAVGEP